MPDPSSWFIANVADTLGTRTDRFGQAAIFEDPRTAPFEEFTLNVRVLQPGQPNGIYHREGSQEGALVLRGECVAIVEDAEHPMREGDYLHIPRGTPHIVVGAGDGPCVLVMAGSRPVDPLPSYPVSAAAQRYGASVDEATDDAMVAYAGTERVMESLGEVPW